MCSHITLAPLRRTMPVTKASSAADGNTLMDPAAMSEPGPTCTATGRTKQGHISDPHGFESGNISQIGR
jgi:hypothetical protein